MRLLVYDIQDKIFDKKQSASRGKMLARRKLVFCILCDERVCFAQKGQPRGIFFSFVFCREVRSIQIWSSCNYVIEFAGESLS